MIFSPQSVFLQVKLLSQREKLTVLLSMMYLLFLCCTAEDVGLWDCAFNIFHKHCFHAQNNLVVHWCFVLKIVEVSVEQMKGGRREERFMINR